MNIENIKNLLCSLGIHAWEKYALMNGHHMCCNCNVWIEERKKKSG